MQSWFLALVLALTPLPNLPWVPSGSEIRVVSTDFRTVFVVWQVDDRRMVLKGNVSSPAGREVRVLFKVGDELKPPYNGVTTSRGDVLLRIDGDSVSLNELLTRTYRLSLPNGRVLPEGQ